MVFSDTSTNLGIIQEIDFLCDSNSTSFPTADKTRRVNAAYEELIGDIINADGTWQFDDTNHTDLPVGTFDLVEGQETYSLPSFATGFLQVEAIMILSLDGLRYSRIRAIDINELPGKRSPDDFFGVESDGSPKKGFPQDYDIQGDTLYLYPAPAAASLTLTAGGKIWFKRTANLFTASDTTQQPGLPSTHHVMLAYMASIPYCMSYKKDRVGWLTKKVDEMRLTLMKHYGFREKDKKKLFRPRRISYR